MAFVSIEMRSTIGSESILSRPLSRFVEQACLDLGIGLRQGVESFSQHADVDGRLKLTSVLATTTEMRLEFIVTHSLHEHPFHRRSGPALRRFRTPATSSTGSISARSLPELLIVNNHGRPMNARSINAEAAEGDDESLARLLFRSASAPLGLAR
jgi:hypothetical protein